MPQDAGANDAMTGSPQSIGQATHPCNNWVDVIAIDEATGEPMANVPYKVFDASTEAEIASGTTDGSNVPQTHCIDDDVREVLVIFGTDDAISEAQTTAQEMRDAMAMQAQQQAEWNGIPGGLSRDQFREAYLNLVYARGRLIDPNISILRKSLIGWGAIFDHVWSGSEIANREFVELNIQLCWEEYQLVTGGREATRGESFGGGVGQGLTFGFGEEMAAFIDSYFDPTRSY